ncbi:MAG: WG repeat-containing protein [Bacteroidota bacterium]
MGASFIIWQFILSLFPNPIIEDGRVGFINGSGEQLIPPSHYFLLSKKPMSLEHFIDINREISTSNEDIDRVIDGQIALFNEEGDSLIIEGRNGRHFDSFSIEKDTVQMYYYLDNENKDIRTIKPIIELQSAFENNSFSDITVNIGLKNSRNQVLTSSLARVTGLKKFFLVSKNSKMLTGTNLIFCNKQIIDLNGKSLTEARQVRFYEGRNYIILSKYVKDFHEEVINLKGETIIPLAARVRSFGNNAFVVYNSNSSPVLMNFQGDTLLSDFEDMSRFRVEISSEENIYGFINFDGDWIIPPEKRDSIRVSLDRNPQSDLFIVKYFKDYKKNLKEGVINEKGNWLLKPKKGLSISYVTDKWVYVCETKKDSVSYFLNLDNNKKWEKSDYEAKNVELIEVSDEKYILKYEKSLESNEFKNVDIYRIDGKKISHTDFRSSIFIPKLYEGEIFVSEEKGKYCLYNLSKSKVVSEGFDDLTVGSLSALDKDKKIQLFITSKNNQKGVINQEGDWLIKPIYHEILPFRGELAMVQMDSMSFQYINRSGETVWKLPETDKTAWNKKDFLESFKDCEPSVYMHHQTFRSIYQYEIMGKAAEGNSCKIQSRFIINPNLEWIGKTMTCTYDNALPFEDAIQPCLPNGDENECDCEGELWEIMSEKN